MSQNLVFDVAEHAVVCVEALVRANACEAKSSVFRMRISKAERALHRAQQAYGEPEVTHKRLVRVAGEVISLLEQGIRMLETDADAADVATHLRKTTRKLRNLQMSLTTGKVVPHAS